MPFQAISGKISAQPLNDNFSYLESLFKTLDKNSPKGVFSSLANLQSALPNGDSNIYVVTADGKWYYWNGSAWIAGGTYQATGIAEGSITPAKTSFFKQGKNLFNKDTAISGYVVNETNGTIYANAAYYASDYIPVLPSTAYTESEGKYLAFYNSSKTFISGLTAGSSPRTFTTPSTAAYVRISCTTAALSTFQLELGSTATPYEPFTQFLDTDSIVKDESIKTNMMAAESVTETKLAKNSVTLEKTALVQNGKNLFDKSTAIAGYYINEVYGTLSANAAYTASDYIPIKPSTAYVMTIGQHLAFYDADKKYISGVYPNLSNYTITSPANAAYIKVSFLNSYLDTFQLEAGTIPTVYEPYGYKFSKEIKNSFLLFLPSEICVAVGRTIELYNSQVAWCGNINNYHFKWDCSIGKAMKRKFSITGTSGLIGEYPLTLTVYDNNMSVVATTSTTIKIVAATITTPKNVLTIGDSLTNGKAWLGELRTLSGNQLTLVGTRGTVPLQHEGRSGFAASSYLTATTYDFEGEGVHPFWDGTRFNWSYYKTHTGVTPDAVQIYLGTNGMALDPTTNAGNIKQIVDYIRQDDATIPIFLVFTLYRGNQDGIGNEIGSDGYTANKGAWKLEEDRKVFNLMTKLNTLLSSYANMHFVPISLSHDSEYNFGAVSTPVNPRATQTELLPSQATHPQNQGYYQMADIMFSVMAKYFSA